MIRPASRARYPSLEALRESRRRERERTAIAAAAVALARIGRAAR